VTSGISGFGDLGGRQTEEILVCTYCGTKTIAGFAKQLKEELLEVGGSRSHRKETQRSVFHKENELKACSKGAKGIYTWEGSHYESYHGCATSQGESEGVRVSYESL